ncbi:uncharacterized protein LOC144905721 [Branchiostoma floridae x Branchiostoma belcheri]
MSELVLPADGLTASKPPARSFYCCRHNRVYPCLPGRRILKNIVRSVRSAAPVYEPDSRSQDPTGHRAAPDRTPGGTRQDTGRHPTGHRAAPERTPGGTRKDTGRHPTRHRAVTEKTPGGNRQDTGRHPTGHRAAPERTPGGNRQDTGR